MSVFKCKMCGGTVEFEQGASVGVCDSCETKQTLPRLDNGRRANLYDRANHFRRNNEFDKASALYEQILNEDSGDAEAYWSIVLCRYGIEYVEDPLTRRRVPTVNRAQFTSIFDDDNYRSALQYADGFQYEIYEQEAKEINEIQKGILTISQKEEPFDVFICYKETDARGRRTPDSVLANELYYQLSQEGFKVFFSRITLEDKLGTAYEPYIFAALNSSKVMVVLGTKPEHFNAVWVKNEWSRYLALVKKSKGQKILIPAYKDMDPYHLPEEFSHLQAQDMSKLGFMQDLTRGIKKITKTGEYESDVKKTTRDALKEMVKETVVAGSGANTAPLLRRAFIFLEDGSWEKADEYCEKVLDSDPENGEAYLGKLMAELQIRHREELLNCANTFDYNPNFQKAVRFGNEVLKEELYSYIDCHDNARPTEIYNEAVRMMNFATTEAIYKSAAEKFQSIPGFLDSDTLVQVCLEKAENCHLKAIQIEEESRQNLRAGIQQKKTGLIMAIIVGLLLFVGLIKMPVVLSNIFSSLENEQNERETATLNSSFFWSEFIPVRLMKKDGSFVYCYLNRREFIEYIDSGIDTIPLVYEDVLSRVSRLMEQEFLFAKPFFGNGLAIVRVISADGMSKQEKLINKKGHFVSRGYTRIEELNDSYILGMSNENNQVSYDLISGSGEIIQTSQKEEDFNNLKRRDKKELVFYDGGEFFYRKRLQGGYYYRGLQETGLHDLEFSRLKSHIASGDNFEYPVKKALINNGKQVSGYNYHDLVYLKEDLFYVSDGIQNYLYDFSKNYKMYEGEDLPFLTNFHVYENLILCTELNQDQVFITPSRVYFNKTVVKTPYGYSYTECVGNPMCYMLTPVFQLDDATKDASVNELLKDNVYQEFMYSSFRDERFLFSYVDTGADIIGDILVIKNYFFHEYLFGAHPSERWQNYLYSISTGKRIYFEELFYDIDAAKKLVLQELKTQYVKNVDGSIESAGKNLADFFLYDQLSDKLSLEKGKMVITYSPYEVSYGARGTVILEIDFKLLKSVMKKEYYELFAE